MLSENKSQFSEEIYSLESKVDNVEKKGNKLYVTATGLTEEFASNEVMQEYAWTFKGKEVRWRHKTPESDPKNLIGHIHEVFVENEKLKFIFEVWGYRNDLKEIQEMIQNNEVSVSAGYKKTIDNSGKVIEIYGRELSITPFPKCTKEMGCGIEQIISNEKNQNQNQNKKDENIMPDDQKELIKILKETIAKNENTIKHLQNTEGKLANERGEQIVRLESTISAMENSMSDRNELIAEQLEELENLKVENDELKVENANLKTLAIRNEIVHLEGITENEAKDAELEDLLQFNEDQLNKMKARLERAAKISEKTSSNRKTPALGEEISENEDLDKISPEQLAARLNPQLKEYIAQNERSMGKRPFSTNHKEDGVSMI